MYKNSIRGFVFAFVSFAVACFFQMLGINPAINVLLMVSGCGFCIATYLIARFSWGEEKLKFFLTPFLILEVVAALLFCIKGDNHPLSISALVLGYASIGALVGFMKETY